MHELPHLFFGPSPARLSTAYYNALSSPETFSDAVWKIPELQNENARPRAVYIAWKGMLGTPNTSLTTLKKYKKEKTDEKGNRKRETSYTARGDTEE